MNEEEQQYANMSLDAFIKQPDTIDFTYINSTRFQAYVADKPYIKLGTIFRTGEYVVAYTKINYLDQIFKDLGSNFLKMYPLFLTPQSLNSNNAAGIYKVQNQPYLNLTGRDVILGFVDTGIDYTKNAFIYENGTSKIKYIWDQTIDGRPPENIRFGAVYSQTQINEALKAEDPFSVVPSKDTNGHGTFLASVAGGRENNDYIGAAPDSEIIAVKLRPPNPYYLELFNLYPEKPLYSSIDFILGIKFILDRAAELSRPVVICIGMGSNFGGHDGDTIVEEYISTVTQRTGIVCVCAAGNESNMKNHTQDRIEKSGDTQTISLNIGENVKGFPMYIFYAAYDKISIEVISPIAESTSRIPIRYNETFSKKMVLDSSVVTVNYYIDSSKFILIDLENPTPGIWNIVLHGDIILNGNYHAWLTGVVNPSVEFLRPSPNCTIMIPGTANRIITCGAYNGLENSLYISSSWGPTRLPRMSPDMTAPGVNVMGVYPTGYGTMTGTSVAAAVTAGACALLLQWGIVNGNEPGMDLERVKSLLISGCKRHDDLQYPNVQWGFGTVNLIDSFEFLKES